MFCNGLRSFFVDEVSLSLPQKLTTLLIDDQREQQGLIGSTMVPVESIAEEMLNAPPREFAWMNGELSNLSLTSQTS